MIALVLAAVVSCIPAGMTVAGTNEPVVAVTGAAILDGANAADAEAFYRRSFAMTDRDGDGYISGAETPLATRGHLSAPLTPTRASPNLWVEAIDNDGDLRASWQEFADHFLPLAAIGRCQRGL